MKHYNSYIRHIAAVIAVFAFSTCVFAIEEHFPHYYADTVKVCFQNGKWTIGKKFLNDGLTLYPDEPNLNWLMGKYFYHFKKYVDARHYLIRAIQNDYSNVEAKQLMIKIEDETKNYSSAIAYCNELLEMQPYDKSLWRKKIELYRKQGNNAIADKLLERASSIYPNDQQFQRDIKYQQELTYQDKMRSGQLNDAADELEKLISKNPQYADYYIDLVNVYKRRGMYDNAIATATAGIVQLGAEQDLVTQKVNLLCGRGQYQEALSFIGEMNAMSRAGYLDRLKKQVTLQAADAARLNDPYDMTAKAYGINRSRESLQYLINTSVSRGYYDDAVYYIDEAMKRDGETAKLMYKRYDLERRAGHTKQADRILDQLYERFPDNDEIMDDYAQKLLRTANDEFIQRDWKSSSSHLHQLIDLDLDDPDLKSSAWSKLITCYCSMHQYEKAKEVYHAAVESDTEGRFQDIYTSLYEDGFITHIKELADDEAWRAVFQEATALLEVVPSSNSALRYAINSADALHLDEEFDTYTTLGYEFYPDEPYYVAHKAMALEKNKQYSDALDILRPALVSLDYNPQLVNVHTDVSELYAYQLMKEHECDSAQIVLDRAIEFAPDVKSLKYAKGAVYEKSKDLISAYKYQSKYADVSLAEYPDFNAAMKGLRYRGAHDKIDIEYQKTTANSQREDNKATTTVSSLATIAYTHQTSSNNYTLTVNYKGVDGDFEDDNITEHGGTGIQGIVQWEHIFSSRFSAFANFGLANDFFSSVAANLSMSYNFNHDWTATLKMGYRRTGDEYIFMDYDTLFRARPRNFDLYIVSPSLSKMWQSKYYVSAQCDVTYMNDEINCNVSGKARIFLNNDAVTCVGIFGAFGRFPELNLFDMNMLHNLSRNNTSVGLEGQWLVAHNLCLGLTGTWFTYYNPRPNHGIIESTYRNLFNLDLQLHIAL
ncbi:MAG: hypothetical protein KBS99_05575 [Prevotellaceae bacterium]|nr:hypothetical protein [Candidatus Colivivens caballi]